MSSPAARVREGLLITWDHERVCTLQQMSPICLDRWRRAVTASRIPIDNTSFTSPVVDYEPPPIGILPPTTCPVPRTSKPVGLHRRAARPLRPVSPAPTSPRDPLPPRAAAVFADAALRRVLEVTDRRRPAAQLRSLLAPAQFDAVASVARSGCHEHPAVLRRVRLRAVTATGAEVTAAEVFATYTRSNRVRAIAGRVELVGGRWLLVAVHIG
jgi:hypothetical protein